MKIEKMDKRTVAVIAAQLEAVLSKFAAEHGLEYKRQGGRYDAISFKPKVEFLIAGGNERNTNLNAELFQYKVRFGDMVPCNGGAAKVVEITNRGKIVMEVGGKKYKASRPDALAPLPKADAVASQPTVGA